MTVCIAAIAKGLWKDNKEYPVIIGAADRMVSTEDIEYERPLSKIIRVTPFIVSLTSGNDAIQAEVVSRTEAHFDRELANNPRFFSVYEVADLYSRNLIDHKKETIERTILNPRALTWDSYNSMLSNKNPEWFKEDMKNVFGNDNLPSTETIIAGVDETGAHLFVIDQDGYISRQDRIGFAAIGIGKWHAESQFMFERHTPLKSDEDTIFLSYLAKRRAEVAPGVGNDTDLVYISLKGGYVELIEEQNALKKLYNSIIKKTEREKTKLKTLIPKILEKVQEERRTKQEKEWEERLKKFAASEGTLGDVWKYLGLKSSGTVTVVTPDQTQD